MLRKRNRPQHKPTKQNSQPNPAATQTFIEHVYELRRRLMWVIGTVLIGTTVAYCVKDRLIQVVIAPLHGNKLMYLNPSGGLAFVFTVCLYCGALLSIPVFIYHVYRFLQPVLGEVSRRLVVGIILCSVLLAMLGVVFGYVLVIPGAIHFLGEFSGASVVANLTADAYLNFVVLHLFGMAAIFQLPLLLFIIDHIHPLPPGSLLRLQRWVIAGSIIVAAMITPTPDPVNLGLVAVPIIIVYEVGVLVVWLRRRGGHNESPETIKKEVLSLPTPVQQSKSVERRSPAVKAPQPLPMSRPRQARSLDGLIAVRTTRPIVPIIDTGAHSTVQERPAPVRRVSIDGISVM